jgi:hypothetical protein
MRVRFLRHYQTYRRGQVYELGDGVARSMVQMGIVEPAPQTLFEQAIVRHEEEQATAPVQKTAKKASKRRVARRHEP